MATGLAFPIRLFGVAVLLAALLSGATHSQAQGSSRTFPETGHTVKDPFLTYWNNNGGLAQQGYPITDELQEVNAADGKTYTTQYFERSRFELHPENADPNFRVLLGLLGKEVFLARYPSGTTASPVIVPGGSGSRFFSETQHTVTGLFLTYWDQHGGLRQQGFPISEAFVEKNAADGKQYITQYFERARFEYHPENADPKFQVLLGLLGKEVYASKHGGQSQPTPVTCVAVHQVFQFAIANNPDLKDKLGCAIDAGLDNSNGVRAGVQEFKYATMIISDPQGQGPSYAYALFANGTYKRIEWENADEGGDPPDPGPHFATAWDNLGGPSVIGPASQIENWGDGALQHFQNGTLIYVGNRAQRVFSVFPTDAPTGTWAKYASR